MRHQGYSQYSYDPFRVVVLGVDTILQTFDPERIKRSVSNFMDADNLDVAIQKFDRTYDPFRVVVFGVDSILQTFDPSRIIRLFLILKCHRHLTEIAPSDLNECRRHSMFVTLEA